MLFRSLRMLNKDRAFSAVVILALSLGIGANTTVFTLVNAVLFKGLPFQDGDRVVYLTAVTASNTRNQMGISFPELADLRAQTKTLSGVGLGALEK